MPGMHLSQLQAGVGAALVALAAIPFPALALWGDRLELYAQENIVYDSNIFRLSDTRAAALGVSEKSDTYYVTTVGANLDLPISRQRFRAGLAFHESRFERNKQLNFGGHDASAVWLWQLGNDLNGDLGYTRSKTLASFTNVLTIVPSTVESERMFASGNYLLTPRWRLGAAVDERTRRYSDPARQVNDVDITGGEASITYLTPRGNSVGLTHRTEEGRFSNQQIVGGVGIDNAYTQDTTSLVVDWTVTPASHLNMRVGTVKREYEQQIAGFADRDFDSYTARVVYDWRPTERFTLTAIALKEVSGIEDIETSFVVIKGFALRPSWRITEKTTLSGSLDSSRREYHGDPTILQRSDRVNSAAVALTWQALRNLQFAATLQHEKRTSNIPDIDYKFTQFGLRGRIGF